MDFQPQTAVVGPTGGDPVLTEHFLPPLTTQEGNPCHWLPPPAVTHLFSLRYPQLGVELGGPAGLRKLLSCLGKCWSGA